jgi:hypothetical protein
MTKFINICWTVSEMKQWKSSYYPPQIQALTGTVWGLCVQRWLTQSSTEVQCTEVVIYEYMGYALLYVASASKRKIPKQYRISNQ